MRRKLMTAVLLAAGAVALPALAVCDHCGIVADVKAIKKDGQGGAYAGGQIEKNQKSTTSYQVTVTMENGATRTFTYGTPTAYKVGDKVKIVDKKLIRQ